MNSKKIGFAILLISIALGIAIWYMMGQLYNKGEVYGCFPNNECISIQKSLSLGNVVVGILSFLFSLGIYLIFFSRGDEAIMKRLEEEKHAKLQEERFDILLKALDPYEQNVIKAVKEQDGITQNTLRIRTDMSKAKLSYVLQELEKRGLIKRVEKGKTLAVYMKEKI